MSALTLPNARGFMGDVILSFTKAVLSSVGSAALLLDEVPLGCDCKEVDARANESTCDT